MLYALQALYSEDFSKGLQEVCFFLVPFTLAYILLRELPWDRRLLFWAFCLVVVEAVALRPDRQRRVPQPQPLLERGGDPLERIPHLLPGQLDLLGPEHLRPLPRPGPGRRHRGDPLGQRQAELLAARRADPDPLARPRADLQPVELHRPAAGLAMLAALRWSWRWTLAVVAGRDRRRRGRRPLHRRQDGHLEPHQRRHLGPRPPDLRRRRTLLRPAALGLRLGLLPEGLREPPAEGKGAGDGLPHRADHGRRRAGADRARRLRRPDRRRAVDDGGGAVGARAGPPGSRSSTSPAPRCSPPSSRCWSTRWPTPGSSRTRSPGSCMAVGASLAAVPRTAPRRGGATRRRPRSPTPRRLPACRDTCGD